MKKPSFNLALILKEHPADVNAHFYTAMSYYHLGKFKQANYYYDSTLKNSSKAFYADAQWFKSLSLLNARKKNDAKSLLNKIVQEGGVYKAQAQEKLKELK